MAQAIDRDTGRACDGETAGCSMSSRKQIDRSRWAWSSQSKQNRPAKPGLAVDGPRHGPTQVDWETGEY